MHDCINLYSNGNLASRQHPCMDIDKTLAEIQEWQSFGCDVIESTQKSTWRQIWNESNFFGWQIVMETRHWDFP